MSKIKFIILIVFILIIADIIIQNQHAVVINFLWWQFTMSIFAIPAIIIISVAAGYLSARIWHKKS